jgi:hypothetical protein
MNNFGKLETLLTEQKARDLIEAIERMSQAVERIAHKVEGTAGSLKGASREIDDAGAKLAENMQSVATSADKAASSMSDASEAAALASSLMLDATDRMVGAFDKALRKLKEDGAAIVAGLTRDLHVSPEALLNNVVYGITRAAPAIGATLDFLISTGIEQSRREAEMRQQLTGFANVQGFGSAELGGGPLGLRQRGTELAQRATSFIGLGLEAKDLSAQLQALQQSGQKYGEAFRQGYNTVFARMPDDALGFAQEIDTSLSLVSGTAMKAAGELARNTDTDFKVALETVNRMVGAARAMGEQFSVVQGAVAQATQALRVQGSDANSLLLTYKGISDTIKSMTQGMAERRQRELAGMAFSDISSALGSYSDPLAGVLYQTIGRLMNVDVSRYGGPEIMMQMQTGFQFADKGPGGLSFDAAKLASMGELFYNQGLSKEDIAIRLNRIGGVGPTGAMALAEQLMQTGGDLTKMRGAGDLENLEKLAQEARKSGEKMAPLNVDTFQTVMKEIKELMQSLGESILTLLGSIARIAMNPFDSDVKDVERRRVGLALSNVSDKFASLAETGGGSIGRLIGAVDGEGNQLKKLEIERALSIVRKAKGQNRDLTKDELDEISKLYHTDNSMLATAADEVYSIGAAGTAGLIGAGKGAAFGVSVAGPIGAAVGATVGGLGAGLAVYGATGLIAPATRLEDALRSRDAATAQQLEAALVQVNQALEKTGPKITLSIVERPEFVAPGVMPVSP